jgi:hypothetical protein
VYTPEGCLKVHTPGAEVRSQWRREDLMADDRDVEMTVVPIPSGETEAEHRRVRSSNDRDQKAEREGRTNRHNKGYDEAADGKAPQPQIARVVDE